jgi:serine/threonine protein phosphatase PrpC
MGNLLGAPVTDKETHTGETACGCKYGVSSMQGWRVHMEDAHICQPSLYAQASPKAPKIQLPDHALFAVFDGHGGSYAAEYAGINFCRVLSRQEKFVQYATFVQERNDKQSAVVPTDNKAEYAQYLRQGEELLEGALVDAFVACDREILLALRGTPEPEAHAPYHEPSTPTTATATDGTDSTADVVAAVPQPVDDEDPGTTIVVVIVTPEWVVCANAGDSRAVFAKSGAKAVPLSYDHKPDDEAEQRRIRDAGGYVAGGRVEGDLAVSRGLGDFRFKQLDTVLNSNKKKTTNDKEHTESMLQVQDQKVSPIPDVIVQNRNKELDEFIIVACDGIWDVQSNYEAVKTVADIFAEGESDLGLVAEEVLDTCLMMGSKDNMTALILQFEAQKIGTGGGVAARRQEREEAENPNHSSTQEGKNSTLYT